jgi:hypothetical protein
LFFWLSPFSKSFFNLENLSGHFFFSWIFAILHIDKFAPQKIGTQKKKIHPNKKNNKKIDPKDSQTPCFFFSKKKN